jgi:F-type H+-transporting ATPase subunit delta
MRGTSRGSLAAVRDQLAAVTDRPAGARGAGRGPAALGDELFAVTQVLDGQPGLRRALADPTRAASARQELATAVFGGKISDAAAELVAAVAAARWSTSADLVDAVEQLAALAVVTAADQAGRLDDVEDELFRFGRIVEANPALRSVLSDPFAPAAGKRQLIDSLLAGKVSPETLRLVAQAAVHGRGRSLEASLAEYARLAAERRDRLVAEVRVAVALTAEQRGRLAAALAQAYGHDVHLNVVLDRKVVGGMAITIGDDLIDGTVATRLAEVRRRLAA